MRFDRKKREKKIHYKLLDEISQETYYAQRTFAEFDATREYSIDKLHLTRENRNFAKERSITILTITLLIRRTNKCLADLIISPIVAAFSIKISPRISLSLLLEENSIARSSTNISVHPLLHDARCNFHEVSRTEGKRRVTVSIALTIFSSSCCADDDEKKEERRKEKKERKDDVQKLQRKKKERKDDVQTVI